jgi:tripartite motif-containing protein 71
VVASNEAGSTTTGPFAVAVPVAPVYVGSSATGTFARPFGIAPAPSGADWVADPSADRVTELSSSGAVIDILTAPGGGSFVSPTGVGLDAGDLWVVDSGAGRVDRIDPTTGSLVGVVGIGTLSTPIDVAFAANGLAYVTDAGHDRVSIFTAGGLYVRSFGTAGHGNGQFELPTSIAVDQNGDVWVADTGNKRIQKFTAVGTHLASYTAAAPGFKSFEEPYGLSVDMFGNLWVTDEHDDTITELAPTGAPALQFGKAGSGVGELDDPTGISVGPNGVVTVSDTVARRVERFAPPAHPAFTADTPPATAVATHNYTYPFVASGAPVPRLSLGGAAPSWLSITGSGSLSGTVPAGTSSFSYTVTAKNDLGSATVGPFSVNVVAIIPVAYKDEFGTGLLDDPAGLAEHANDFFVTNYQGDNVVEFDSSGAEVRAFGSSGSGPGDLDGPAGAAVEGSKVLVADAGNERINEYSPAGASLGAIGSAGTGDGQFSRPFGVAVDAAGNIWVTDITANRLEEFASSGTYKAQIDTSTAVPLDLPAAIAVAPNGDLVVANYAHDDILELTPSGQLVATIASSGSGPGQLDGPFAVAVDGHGNIWVTDSGNQRIEEFTSAGLWLQTVGSEGTGPGQFDSPEAVTVDSSGLVSVSDASNNRIEQFAPTA